MHRTGKGIQVRTHAGVWVTLVKTPSQLLDGPRPAGDRPVTAPVSWPVSEKFGLERIQYLSSVGGRTFPQQFPTWKRQRSSWSEKQREYKTNRVTCVRLEGGMLIALNFWTPPKKLSPKGSDNCQGQPIVSYVNWTTINTDIWSVFYIIYNIYSIIKKI